MSALASGPQSAALPSRDGIDRLTFADETELVGRLVEEARLAPQDTRRVAGLARRLVHAARAGRRRYGGVDAFMHEYSLSSEEGVTLMCLAEALLRIPDAETADRLIADKIAGRDWEAHLGHSDSLFVNASTWGLMLTGKVVDPRKGEGGWGDTVRRLVARSGEPVIRQAMRHAMRIMGRQFVLGRTIEEALSLAAPDEARGYRFSYDMLGEAAVTMADADRYYASYEHALRAAGQGAGAAADLSAAPSLSVKLSALHPRFEAKQEARVMAELAPRVLALAELARSLGMSLTIDAEEQDRLDLGLQVFAFLAAHPALAGWDGLGLAVQAYGRRAGAVVDWLGDLAEATFRRIPVRLVKGAYWDTEIKRAQEGGFQTYPVFTRKAATDVSYLACARRLLAAPQRFFSQFATHNAHTVASIAVMAQGRLDFEFQRLHGMGRALYEDVAPEDRMGLPCRIYAPVGSHEDLLAYLVRRLLENGANSSFVNRLADDEAPITDIVADPVEALARTEPKPHPGIPAPADLFMPERRNSRGVALWRRSERESLLDEMRDAMRHPVGAVPLVTGADAEGEPIPVASPHDPDRRIGSVVESNPFLVQSVARSIRQSAVPIQQAAAPSIRQAAVDWDRLGGAARAEILDRAADMYEAERASLMAYLVAEAGKSLENALSDFREAVDFIRYYASRARVDFTAPTPLPGPTGEENLLSLHGRGVFVCISPWNFPLAIFTGQVAAALAAGNAVLAKPAEQTPLVAFRAVQLLHRAGIPLEVLSFLPGPGEVVGAALAADPAIDGVAFTGSNAAAEAIHRALATRGGPIVPLIAETGGINVMIVDSSALPEQVVKDAVRSAFDSAGQRCSAARVMFVQDDIAPRLLPMLRGALEQLSLGDPIDYSTDIGPVIDEEARASLEGHKARIGIEAKVLVERPLPAGLKGHFVGPAIYEIERFDMVDREIFGPVLHVVCYSAGELGRVCDAINAAGYGLTLGVHSRIGSTVDYIAARVRVGNLYVNRNQIGAVVGSQPFGGEGLSGTGPKAGGPHYLHRFAVERVRSTDVTASGGNAALMSLREE